MDSDPDSDWKVRQSSRFPTTPVVVGRLPNSKAVREGLHSGAAVWAFANKTPSFARSSMLGVFACGCPPRQPTQSFKSSIAMNKTFGLSIASVD